MDLCSFEIFLSEYRRYYVRDDSNSGARTMIVEQLCGLKMEFTRCGGTIGTVCVDHLFDRYMTLIPQLPTNVGNWGITLPALFGAALTKGICDQMGESYKLPPAGSLLTMRDQINALCTIKAAAITAANAILR